jgi:hypothetical protein
MSTSNEDVNKESLEYIQSILKSEPVYLQCPSCRNTGKTIVKTSWNTYDVILFIATIGLGWLVVKVICSKDFNVYDAEHSCSSCNKRLGKYSALPCC